jgi:hypothetical protein
MDGRAAHFFAWQHQRELGKEVPWSVLGRAETWGIENQLRCGFFLRGLGHERNPISILMAVEIDGGRLAMAAQFDQPLVTASSSPEASLVTGTLPMVVVGLGEAFPGD